MRTYISRLALIPRYIHVARGAKAKFAFVLIELTPDRVWWRLPERVRHAILDLRWPEFATPSRNGYADALTPESRCTCGDGPEGWQRCPYVARESDFRMVVRDGVYHKECS